MGRSRTTTGRKAVHALGIVTGPPLEADEQSRVFDYLKTKRTHLVENNQFLTLWDFAFAVPNGSVLAGDAGQRARQMNSMKAQGLKPAVSDIVIALPVFDATRAYHGMFLEMKRVKGSRVDPAQVAWAALMRRVGYYAEICKGFDDAKTHIDFYHYGS